MVTPFKKTKKKYQKFIFDFKANFYTKFEENLKTSTYHLFFILHESYVNLYLKRQPISTLCIGECPSIAPFLKNNGPRPRKGPRCIVFKEWSDARTFAYIKSTHRLQPLPQYM